MGIENNFSSYKDLHAGTKRLAFQPCPDDFDSLRSTDYCVFYNSELCKKTEHCRYYVKKQAEKQPTNS